MELEVLQGLPRAFRALRGRGALPQLENLLRLNVDQLVSVLNRFGIQPDLDAIERRALRAFSRLEDIIAQGVTPDDATWEAVDRQIQREVAETLRQQVKAAIRNYQNKRLEESGAQLFVWVAVGDQNTCPSCEVRHGVIGTLREWRGEGLPGSAALICASECRCVLQPVFE